MTYVDTSSGRVRGRVEDDQSVFRGIPYAAPPVGSRRFAAPETPQPWDVLDAGSFGPIPPQSAPQDPTPSDPDDPEGG